VRATIYDIGRYWISSESGADDYLVDTLGKGWCDCDDFRIRVDGLKVKNTCKHLDFAREQFRRDFPEDDRARIIAQQKKPGFAPPITL
jgi:hypothetical protein